MLIHDDIFAWEGFGGMLRLAAGICRLRLLDLGRQKHPKVALIKPMVAVVSDLPENTAALKTVSVRSCASHIATLVASRFDIDPQRMTYVEYYPPTRYGNLGQNTIPAKLDAVDFTWFDDKAMHPKWRPLASPLREVVMALLNETTDDPAAVPRGGPKP